MRRGAEQERVEFFGTPPATLVEILGGRGRAQIPWQRVRHGLDPFAAGVLPEGSRRRLMERCLDLPLSIVERRAAACGTTKILSALRDGALIESVVIPSPRRTTVCISSQVGCGRGCSFCLTGAMGLRRSLTPAEMVAQVVLAVRQVALQGWAALRNVVFMGMGEPLDNLPRVREALALMTAPHGLGLGPSRITLSTVGTSPARIRECRDLGVRLAWSLHSADPQIRRRLVPSDRHELQELRAAFLELIGKPHEDLFVEVALIRDLNDGAEDAEAMVEFLRPFHPHARVNLLPLNRGPSGLAAASAERTEAYRDRLYAAGVRCIIRQPRGAEIGAACGQLATAGPSA